MLPFCHSTEHTAVLAVDVAKTKTGFAIYQVPAQPTPQDELKLLSWGTYLTDVRNDKTMFLVGNELADQIGQEIQRLRNAGHNVCMMVEHPIFGQLRSEQQYHLFQSVLSVAAELHVNVTTVTPTFLKVWIKSQIPNADAVILESGLKIKKNRGQARYGVLLEKHHIKYLYDNFTQPANPWLPTPDKIRNDDEYDALFLGLIGATFITTTPDLNTPIFEFNLNAIHDQQAFDALPWRPFTMFDDMQPFVKDKPRTYTNFTWRPEGVTHLHKALKTNGFRKPACKFDFLFNQLAATAMLFDKQRQLDPAKADAWIKPNQGKRTKKDLNPLTMLNMNYAGQWYVHVPLERQA